MVNGISVYLGTFDFPEEGAQARNAYIIDNNLREYKIQTIKNQEYASKSENQFYR